METGIQHIPTSERRNDLFVTVSSKHLDDLWTWFRKCYFVCDEESSKSAQKGIKHRNQTCRRQEFLDALYQNEIPVAFYHQLNYNKSRSQMALTSVTKPALNTCYTKFRVVSSVICQPYEDWNFNFTLLNLRMIIFTTKERDQLTAFVENRPKFSETPFSGEELQLLNSQNFANNAWLVIACKFKSWFKFRNTLQLSPALNPRFCQLNLGLTNVPIGDEIKAALECIQLPAHIRIGLFYLYNPS